jgi:hypothetical protein
MRKIAAVHRVLCVCGLLNSYVDSRGRRRRPPTTPPPNHKRVNMKHSIRPLPNPEECQGYPPSMMMDKPDCELNFLLDVNDGNSSHCLACSFITRGKTNYSSTNITFGEQLSNNIIHIIDKTKPVIIICHGSFSWRNQMLISNLASKLSIALDVHTLRFDFTGNGHSSGEWKFGNLEQDYQDLCHIVDFVCSSLVLLV